MIRFCVMITAATVAFAAFFVVRFYLSSVKGAADGLPEAVYNQKSIESLDKVNAPKIFKDVSSNSQSSD